jgi:hypothetical protein
LWGQKVSDDTVSIRKTAVALVSSASEQERVILLNWAQQMLAIRDSNLPTAKKVVRIVQVTRELGIAGPFFDRLWGEFKRIAWVERSGPMRGVIAGAGVGLLASIAGPMAGVAAFGGAVAVPVIILGAGGGALLMAIVDELTNSK